MKLLFQHATPDGARLFEATADLARAIAKQPAYDGKERSLASFLKQILDGDRACPTNLAGAIENAVRHRLRELPELEQDAWAKRVSRALEIDNAATATLEPLDAERLYFELENTAEEASEHFIITASPLEQMVAPKAQTLRQILLRRLGLIDLLVEPKTRYTFCVPSEEAAHDWWTALFRENKRKAVKGARRANAREFLDKLKSLNSNDQLRVFAVRPVICGIPVVVFDPEDRDPSGFVFFYHNIGSTNPNTVSIAKMSGPCLKDWKDSVYWPLDNGEEQRKAVPIPADLSKESDP